MTQIIVTLEPGADTSFLKKAIDNMKGVFRTYVEENSKSITNENKSNEWLEKLHQIKSDINPDLVDMNDERTRYLMSK